METMGGRNGAKGRRSLNRTMQYGNSCEKKMETNKIEKFKSYYVVWKQYDTQKNR